MSFFLTVGLTVLCAGAVQGVIGFGFGMLAMSVLTLLVPLPLAVGTVSGFALLLNLWLVHHLRRDLSWRRALPLMAGAVVGVPLGVWALASLDATVLRVTLGCVVLAYALSELLGLAPRRRRPIAPGWALPFGIAGGVLQGGLVAGGPPVVVYATLTDWAPRAVRATLHAYFITTGVIQVGTLLATGMVRPGELLPVAALCPVMLLGAWGGSRVSDRLDREAFRRLVLLGLLVLGVVFVVRG